MPNRPTFATTAPTVQRGVLEIEYGFQGDRAHQNINGVVKFGIFNSLELRFAQNPIEIDSGIASTGDCGIGFKWKFLVQHQARPDVALLYSSTVSAATSQLGVAAIGHSVQGLISKDFGKEHFDFNEGVQFVGRGAAVSGFDRNYFSALSWSRVVIGKWGATAELAGFSWTNSKTPATMTVLTAATYSVSPRLVLDAGALETCRASRVFSERPIRSRTSTIALVAEVADEPESLEVAARAVRWHHFVVHRIE